MRALETVHNAAGKHAERLRWLGYRETVREANEIDAARAILGGAPLSDDRPSTEQVAKSRCPNRYCEDGCGICSNDREDTAPPSDHRASPDEPTRR